MGFRMGKSSIKREFSMKSRISLGHGSKIQDDPPQILNSISPYRIIINRGYEANNDDYSTRNNCGLLIGVMNPTIVNTATCCTAWRECGHARTHWDGFFGKSIGNHVFRSFPASDTLWLFNIAMENCQSIDDFPIKTSIYKGFSMAMLNNQMVCGLGFNVPLVAMTMSAQWLVHHGRSSGVQLWIA